MCKDKSLHHSCDGSCRRSTVEGYFSIQDSIDSPEALKDSLDVEDLDQVVINEFGEMTRTDEGHESIQNQQHVEAPSQESKEGLARLLKKGTARSHRAAENVHFVRDFMQHKVSADSYKELLGALFHVYSTLEEELDRCSKIDSRVRAVHFPFLARRASLLQDLQYFHGDDGAALATALHNPSPVAKQYVDRLREIGKSQPLLLVAHSYTRYLGDLSGGQLLAKAAVKAFNLSEENGIENGTSFFQFKELSNATAFKYEYRAALDGLLISQSEVDDLVDEANLAFIHKMRLFQERDVAAGYITAVQSVEDAKLMVTQAKSALTFQNRYAELGFNPNSLAQCPFLIAHGLHIAIYGSGKKCPFLPEKHSFALQRMQRTADECPMKRFASFFLPEHGGLTLVLFGSLLIGSVLQHSFPIKKLA